MQQLWPLKHTVAQKLVKENSIFNKVPSAHTHTHQKICNISLYGCSLSVRKLVKENSIFNKVPSAHTHTHIRKYVTYHYMVVHCPSPSLKVKLVMHRDFKVSVHALTLFIPSNYRGINLSGPSNFQCWGKTKNQKPKKQVHPQNKLKEKKTIVFVTLKFCVNVGKCLILMF